jgi:DNA-binding transcriptional MerR regulator
LGRFIDITGKEFGKLTVLDAVRVRDNKGQSIVRWNCLCECGNQVVRDGKTLKNGQTKSCGACVKNTNLSGKRFGRLTVVSKCSENGDWNCNCDCGNEKAVNVYNLLRGIVKSCGCLSRELIIERNKKMSTHSMTGTRLHNIWDTMKARCHRPNSKDYKNYGARGVMVCEEWRNSFEAFYRWATENGYQEDLTLDREDVNGNYEPTNCRWVTTKQQGNNTRVNRHITINGETKTIAEWADLAGVSPKALRYRIESGWEDKDLLVPVGVQKVYVTIGDETKTITEWAREKGVSNTVVGKRYKAGVRGDDLFEFKRKIITVEIDGVTKSLVQWAKETGIDHSTLSLRYKKGLRGVDLIASPRKRNN